MSSLGKGMISGGLSVITRQRQSCCFVAHVRSFPRFLVLWMQHLGCPAIFQLLTI